MMRWMLAFSVLLFAITGCGGGGALTTGRAGYVLSSVRLPITIPMPVMQPNKPLGLAARQRLEELDRLASERSREKVLVSEVTLPRDDGVLHQLAEGTPLKEAAELAKSTLRSLRLPREPEEGDGAQAVAPAERESGRFPILPKVERGLARLGERGLGRWKSEEDRVDAFEDLLDRETVVMVAVSGGGARAAVFARHIMEQLEQAYNEVRKDSLYGGRTRSLFDSIDAYSAVSGGSVYLSHVAGKVATGGPSGDADEDHAHCDTFFGDLASKRWTILGTTYLGAMASVAYLWPVNTALTLATDFTYLDLLAFALKVAYAGPWRPSYYLLFDHGVRLGRLGRVPRFYFNSVCMDTGTPFVFTQRVVHLPSETPVPLLRTFRPPVDFPLSGALTLENINSSPSRFPLAYAAIASAAFPILQDPLRLRKYDYVKSHAGFLNPMRLFRPTMGVRRSSQVLRLSDGGIYDNSGMYTAVSLFEYLVMKGKVRQLVLLQISAENAEYDVAAATAIGGAWEPLADFLPNGVFPVRGLLEAPRSLALLCYLNERRVEKEQLERLNKLVDDSQRTQETGVPEGVRYHYFPVRLSRLSPHDPLSVECDDSVFRNVQKIPTDFTIGPGHDEYLAKAAGIILASPCEPERPPGAAPAPSEAASGARLDVAFARAVLRAQQAEREPAP